MDKDKKNEKEKKGREKMKVKEKKGKGSEAKQRLRKKIPSWLLRTVISAAFSISIYAITKEVLEGKIDPSGGVLALFPLVVFFIVWLTKSIMRTPEVKIKDSGGEEHKVPAYAIVTRWGGPIWVGRPGRLYWRWWPIDVMGRLIPTFLYKMDIAEFEVHTRGEKEGESAKPVKVVVSVHLNFPQPGEKYDLHESEIPDNEIPRPWSNILEEGTLTLKGEKLLMNLTFFTLPQEIMLDELKMANRFRAAIMDGLITQMPQFSYKLCRENKKELEEAVKKYWLTDPANVFVRVGIPPRLLDVSATFMRATDDRVENALYIEEIETIEGRAEAQRRTLGIGGAHKRIKASLSRNLPAVEKERMAQDYLTRQMSLDKDALRDYRVKGAQGIERSALNVVALLGDLFGVQKPSPGKKEQEEKDGIEEGEKEEKEVSPKTERVMKRTREILETLRKQGKRKRK